MAVRKFAPPITLISCLVIAALVIWLAPSVYQDICYRGVFDLYSLGFRFSHEENKPNLTIVGGTAAERRKVVKAYQRIEYPLKKIPVQVVIVDSDPEWEALFDPVTGKIYLCGTASVDVALTHEIGHLVEYHFMSPADRRYYVKLRKLPKDFKWTGNYSRSNPWERNASEDFAEEFALLFNRRVKTSEVFTSRPLQKNPTELRKFYLSLID